MVSSPRCGFCASCHVICESILTNQHGVGDPPIERPADNEHEKVRERKGGRQGRAEQRDMMMSGSPSLHLVSSHLTPLLRWSDSSQHTGVLDDLCLHRERDRERDRES